MTSGSTDEHEKQEARWHRTEVLIAAVSKGPKQLADAIDDAIDRALSLIAGRRGHAVQIRKVEISSAPVVLKYYSNRTSQMIFVTVVAEPHPEVVRK